MGAVRDSGCWVNLISPSPLFRWVGWGSAAQAAIIMTLGCYQFEAGGHPFMWPDIDPEDCTVTHCCTPFRFGHGGSPRNLTENDGVSPLWGSPILINTGMTLGWGILGSQYAQHSPPSLMYKIIRVWLGLGTALSFACVGCPFQQDSSSHYAPLSLPWCGSAMIPAVPWLVLLGLALANSLGGNHLICSNTLTAF